MDTNIHHLSQSDWLQTSQGESRGYIQPDRLDELWLHTGTNCNLSCSFCFEHAGPGDKRIELLSYDIACKYIDDAVKLGVKRFCFTGGEPFVNPDFVRILAYAQQFCPCLVLTNGTNPLIKRMKELEPLRGQENSVTFRISIDHPVKENHDKFRGEGNFEKSIQSLKLLMAKDFDVAVAHHYNNTECLETLAAEFALVFKQHGIQNDISLVSFPELEMKTEPPEITENCMTTYCTDEKRKGFMCAHLKMIAVKNGQPGIYACTLVDDDEDYNLGTDLEKALAYRIMMRHKRCFTCFSSGVSCSG